MELKLTWNTIKSLYAFCVEIDIMQTVQSQNLIDFTISLISGSGIFFAKFTPDIMFLIRFVQGSSDDGYYLTSWSVIDIFVYFSHYFITIPPVTWINAAHRNGTAVLGTFITEFDDGFKRYTYFLGVIRL